jgi:hypothetical protein
MVLSKLPELDIICIHDSCRVFGPAAELAPWRVPKGATVVVEAKVAKIIDAPSGLIQ